MRIISFGWTSPAILARRKTVTRRDWKASYARTFHKGELLQAWDKSPRTRKGKKIGVIRLTAEPSYEPVNWAPNSDYEAEGFEYLDSIGARVNRKSPVHLWTTWLQGDVWKWVLRFEIISLEGES